MYQLFKKAGYYIKIKKILEFNHESIFKNYIEFYIPRKNNILWKIKER